MLTLLVCPKCFYSIVDTGTSPKSTKVSMALHKKSCGGGDMKRVARYRSPAERDATEAGERPPQPPLQPEFIKEAVAEGVKKAVENLLKTGFKTKKGGRR